MTTVFTLLSEPYLITNVYPTLLMVFGFVFGGYTLLMMEVHPEVE